MLFIYIIPNMKILVITDYNNKTWIWSQNYNLYSWFKKKWIDSEIINLVSKQWYKVVPDYWINIISNRFKNPSLNFWFWVFHEFKKQLNRHLKENHYDFVLLGHQWLAYLYNIVAKNCSNFWIVVLDLFPLYNNLKTSKIKNFIYNKLMLKNLEKFNNIMCISDFTVSDYKRLISSSNEKKIISIPCWFDIKPAKFFEKDMEIFKKEYWLQGKKVILHVWSEEYRKNIPTFLKIAMSYSQDPDIIFVRIWEKSKLATNFIKNNKLNNIKYLSWLSVDTLAKFYSIANLYLYTSTLEWFGRPLVEAYLNDVVCISSKVSDMDTIFQNSKNVHFVSDPYNVKEYLSLIDANIDAEFKPENIDVSLDTEINRYLAFIKNILTKK